MYKILTKKILNPTVTEMDIEAPLVANKARAGQFIILRVDEEGERIPLTVAGVDKDKGSVKIWLERSINSSFRNFYNILNYIAKTHMPANTSQSPVPVSNTDKLPDRPPYPPSGAETGPENN